MYLIDPHVARLIQAQRVEALKADYRKANYPRRERPPREMKFRQLRLAWNFSLGARAVRLLGIMLPIVILVVGVRLIAV